MGTLTVCARCQHPLNSHGPATGSGQIALRCNVAGPGFVCDCGQPVIVHGELVVGYVDPTGNGEGNWYGFTSFRDDPA